MGVAAKSVRTTIYRVFTMFPAMPMIPLVGLCSVTRKDRLTVRNPLQNT